MFRVSVVGVLFGRTERSDVPAGLGWAGRGPKRSELFGLGRRFCLSAFAGFRGVVCVIVARYLVWVMAGDVRLRGRINYLTF